MLKGIVFLERLLSITATDNIFTAGFEDMMEQYILSQNAPKDLSPLKPTNPKYILKSYKQMIFSGLRVQIDVKHVPVSCIVGDAAGQKFFSILP